MYQQALKTGQKIFATAPMIDWSDRHYRHFARQLTKNAVLYTEMIVADAILRGNRHKLLGYDPVEHPLALQLGGSDPQKLAEAARIGEDFGYDEINMNVGCPSDRVQSGTFGACLMREPQLVADCVAAMKAAVNIPVTVKCRIGVDDQNPEMALRDLVSRVKAAGVDAVWVHARKAWLQGLSPKENRDIPPLDYDLVRRLKAENSDLFIGLNGGLHTLDQAVAEIGVLDGAMLGRAAYQDSGMLVGVDAVFALPGGIAPLCPFGASPPHGGRSAPAAATEDCVAARKDVETPDVVRAAPNAASPAAAPDTAFWEGVRDAMLDYAGRVIAGGGRLNHVTRHMVGLFQGFPGARRYRQILSADATRPGAGPEVIAAAFAAVLEAAADKAAAE
ncbi:tRNA dihydrouridine(20/20a) synthase DusA [Rhizobium sp. ARZ01]|uniref:tRNA dihydrouridine(20/20a) synthase DusA n=1 Tax=Rhizobium sp. ARZ01 TaxID=2769313 RepID=UPI00177D743C|nr:tRNA dihydrouridine(20/20a) synthase DusA [Rhizobium sp. ARZ01]MBD9372182.1 tRNA dihydrouridine(20/20a) synthase DusA [Rhizobium sp. ARZ01]